MILSHVFSILVSAFLSQHNCSKQVFISGNSQWDDMIFRVPTGPAKSRKVPKNEKLNFRPAEVLKLDTGPEKVLIFGQHGPEKLIWPAY